MMDDKLYKIMQIEQWKLELLEQESTIKMDKRKAEAERECLNVKMERMVFKVDMLRHRVQLLKEGISQDDKDIILPMVNDYPNISI